MMLQIYKIAFPDIDFLSFFALILLFGAAHKTLQVGESPPPRSRWRQTEQDAATTMLHSRYNVRLLMSSVGFVSNHLWELWPKNSTLIRKCSKSTYQISQMLMGEMRWV